MKKGKEEKEKGELSEEKDMPSEKDTATQPDVNTNLNRIKIEEGKKKKRRISERRTFRRKRHAVRERHYGTTQPDTNLNSKLFPFMQTQSKQKEMDRKIEKRQR